MPLLTVALTDCDGPSPPPEAVAIFMIETALRSVCVMVYVAVHVTVRPGVRVTFASPQLNGAAPMSLSLTVN